MTAPLPSSARAVLEARLPADDDPVRPLMQLATVDEEGRPDARSVLLSAWDEEGFQFHTDADSRKAAQLAAGPAVALVLVDATAPWQIVVRGHAEPAGAERDAAAYGRRSPYLRRLAWENTAATALLEPAARAARWARSVEERADAALSPAPGWTGFLVRPDRLTFWQSDPDGPSHRTEFRLGADGAWSEHHLPG